LQRVEKVAAQGREFYMPVVDNKKHTYLSKPAHAIHDMFGSLHNESEIRD